MKHLNPKPFVFIFMLVSGIAWFAIALASGLNLQDFTDFMRPVPTVVTIDLILASIFVKWLWRWRMFQGWLVPFPDLYGTWQGHIESNWKNDQGKAPAPIPAVLTIKQSFTRLSCVMRTAEMESHSYVEGFWIDKDAQVRRLCYSYTSRPKEALQERSASHDGTILFNIVGTPVRKLEGEYWTLRNTRGSVSLAFRTKDLLDELPADLPPHPVSETEQGGSTQ